MENTGLEPVTSWMPFKRAAELVGNNPRKKRETADFAGFLNGYEATPSQVIRNITLLKLNHMNGIFIVPMAGRLLAFTGCGWMAVAIMFLS